MNEDRLWVYKFASPVTPGNFSPITACGGGAVEYKACIEGKTASEFYEAGTTVVVGVQQGSLGVNTPLALETRYAVEGADNFWECDVEATPYPVSGWDRDGKERAWEKYVTDAKGLCANRLVSIPVLDRLPDNGNDPEGVIVLGVATFAIVKWDRTPQVGNATASHAGFGSEPTKACGDAKESGNVDTTVFFECHMVWGYFMKDARPPDALLSISDSDNPFAPLIIAMVE